MMNVAHPATAEVVLMYSPATIHRRVSIASPLGSIMMVRQPTWRKLWYDP